MSKITDYKSLKKIIYDQVGKRLFILDPINKDEVIMDQRKNKAADTKKLKQSFFSINIGQKLVNQDFSNFLMVTTNIDQTTGSKKILISSSVRILNELDQPIYLRFRGGRDIDERPFKLKSRDSYYIPLTYLLYESTEVAVSAEVSVQHAGNEPSQHKFYGLSQLVHDR